MGAKEEETGNVVKGPALVGDQWFLISYIDGTEFCCHLAASWFDARVIAQRYLGDEAVEVELLLYR